MVRGRPDPAGLDAFFFSEDLYYLPEAAGAFISLLDSTPPKWMQTASTGVDHAIFAYLIESGAIVTNSPGVHGSTIAEYVFAYILSHAKRLPQHAANQSEHQWAPLESVELAGQTLGIVGYGGIGEACARLGKAFGMRTVATKRRPPDMQFLDEHYATDRLHELLAASDYVVLCCPLTDETINLMDADALAAMPSDALLINVARAGLSTMMRWPQLWNRERLRGRCSMWLRWNRSRRTLRSGICPTARSLRTIRATSTPRTCGPRTSFSPISPTWLPESRLSGSWLTLSYPIPVRAMSRS